MKSAKIVRRMMLLSAIGAMISFAAACTNPVADTLGASNWGLVGNWVNPAAPGAPGVPTPTNCYRLTLASDGTLIARTGGYPDTTGTYRIDGVSTNANARQFKVLFQYSTPIITTGALVRITDGSTYEVCTYNPPTSAYPPDIISVPGAYFYAKFNRE